MNILFVSDRSPEDRSSYTNRVLFIKEALQKWGANADIFHLRISSLKTPYLLQPLKTPEFIRLVKDYEIISLQGLVASFAMYIAKKLVDVKFVNDVHGSPVAENYLLRNAEVDLRSDLSIIQSKMMESLAYRRDDYFVTCSKALEQYHIRKGVRKERISIIRNGVDTQLFKPSNTNLENETFTVTYAGAFQKWQGIENLIRAAELLEKSDVKFKIIGFTNNDFLKKEIRQRLGNKAELIDRLPRTELVQHLHKSDILVIPRSKHLATELAFPTKFAEYIAVGKPVIVTRVDETSRFVIKNDCGFVCEPTQINCKYN